MTRIPLKTRYLGEQDYASCYQNMQAKILDNIALKKNGVAVVNELWIVEHPSVYTLGQAGDEVHVLNAQGTPVVKTDRGGQVTWHGKGQLVAYFLFDLSTLDWHVRQLVNIAEKSICELIKPYLADGFTIKVRKDAPGVYIYRQTCDNEILHGKIASLGFKIKRGFSYHGIAININADLTDFSRINPCGYKGMTMINLTDVCTEKSLVDFSQLQREYAELLLDCHN